MEVAEALSVLGVNEDASWAEVRASYRRLLLSNHPDVHRSAGASKRTARIISAYELLTEVTANGRKPFPPPRVRPPGAFFPQDGQDGAPQHQAASSAVGGGVGGSEEVLGREPAHSPGVIFGRLRSAAAEIGELRSVNRRSGTIEVLIGAAGRRSTLKAEVGRNEEGETIIGFTLRSPAETAPPPIRPIVERLLSRIRGTPQ